MTIEYAPTFGQPEKDIRNWFIQLTGLASGKVIWMNQMAKRPQRPYLALNIITKPTPLGLPESDITEESGQGKETIFENQEMTVSAQYYSDTHALATTAFSYMEKIKQASYLDSSVSYLRQTTSKLALVDRSPITNIDEQLGNRWEKRAAMDFIFRYRTSAKDDIDLIEEVKFKGAIRKPDASEIEVKEITVTK